MSRIRSLWFESRHLDTGAPELRARLAALPDDERAVLLGVGDRLAALSLTLAQQYCRRAPDAWALGVEAFTHWIAGAERLAGGDHGSRNAAAAYFTLPPAMLAALAPRDLDAWLTLAHDVLATSRRLGEAFVAASGPVLGDLTPGDPRLARWVAEGLSLARHGFDGESLALRFFEATALAMPLFAPTDFPHFAALGQAAARAGRADRELFTSVPPALHDLDERERGGVLQLAHLVAERAPVVAVEAYFSLPSALVAAPESRAALLASLTPVAHDAPETLPDLLPVLRAILHRTPSDVRPRLIELAGRVASVFPTGAVPFYRMIPRLLERTGVDGIERWVQAGVDLAVDHPDAGAAYFGLDSRTSRAVLAAESTAIELPEVQGLLKRFLQMLTGEAWRVDGRADVGYRPPFEEPEADDAAADAANLARLALFPARLDTFADTEDLAQLAEDARFYLDGGDTLADGEEVGGQAPEAPKPIDERLPEVQLTDEESDAPAGVPLDPEELLKLLQSGARITAAQDNSEELAALGLYVSDLAGKLPRERMAELQGLLRQAAGRATALSIEATEGQFLYDEWDHRIGDYRHAWCRLAEIPLESDTGDFFHQTLANHAELLPEVRRQFQRIRPERYRVIHGLEDGEDFDLDAVITARADRRSGSPPSPKLYQARQREERDVATLFLVDMSASTDEPVPDAPAGRRVIDITKEALVVMAEALEEIGDTYGIYGFSGHGRQQVELYVVKHFNEPLTSAVKGRIGAIEPKRSTRMGTALRHAVAKMRAVAARSKHVILLSDGFPQDVDYGDDRRSNVYGIQDTTMAFQEAARAGVTPFCITVDKAGHDYLKEMCEASRYLVIDDITALPRELPKIYQRFVRP